MKTHPVESEFFKVDGRTDDERTGRQTDIKTLIVAVHNYGSNKIMASDNVLSFLNSK